MCHYFPPTTSGHNEASGVDEHDSGDEIGWDAARDLDEIETRTSNNFPPSTSGHNEALEDDEYDAGDEIDSDVARELDAIETAQMQLDPPSETRDSPEPVPLSKPTPTSTLRSGPRLQDLREASTRTCAQPFFSHLRTFAVDSDSEDGFDSQNDADNGANSADVHSSQNKPHESNKAWFKKPKYMSDSVYTYFGNIISPIILKKDGQSLAKPKSFKAKAYGFSPPAIAYSDDPVKDKHLVYSAFPSLAENLTPISAAYGLQSLEIPHDVKTTVLSSSELVEGVAASMFAALDADPDTFICVYMDFEWNVSRRVGVSIMTMCADSDTNHIYIIPVHKLQKLPASLLHILTSNRVFKIGSAIKGDLTHLKKQFSQLSSQSSFTVIDLKEYAIKCGVIQRKSAGSLDALLEKCLGLYLPKDDALQKHDGWETRSLPSELLDYAAKDVYASHLLFEKLTELSPIERVTSDTPGGTPVKILVQAGGEVSAYGHILYSQPSSLGTVRVAVPSKNRLAVEINRVIIPAASALLHLLPSPSGSKTKSGAYTLGQLQAASGTTHFPIVVPISLLEFSYSSELPSISLPPMFAEQDSDMEMLSTSSALIPDATNSEDELSEEEPEIDNVNLDMLEAHSASASKDKGKQRELSTPESIAPTSIPSPLLHLRTLIESPPDADSVFQRLQKDIFHAFHMIPTPINHGMCPAFLCALRDHILRWDPVIRAQIDATCQRVFHMTFDEMLIRNPRYIAARCPRHVPSPSILVPALEYVFGFFGPSLDAKTGQPLFSKLATQKAKAVVDLARQGYLSNIKGVVLYEKAGVDQHGLQIYRCLRGTNKVEGGPHGDIYRKFGALNAGPRLTNNCLTDHRTWYNLQAFAQHIYGVDWEFHHQLGLINRTSLLLNYLSDFLDGARSYSSWINPDLYQCTDEMFGVCALPEPLQICFGMEPYSQEMAELHKLNRSDDWLRRRQGLAFPAVPPSTPEARQYFFTKIREQASLASAQGRGKIDYELSANEWNSSADGKNRYYVTPEVLAAYAKSWEKTSNIRASQELVSDDLEHVQKSATIFAAPDVSFPDFLEGLPIIDEPARGLVNCDDSESTIVPASISTQPPVSQSLFIPPAVRQPLPLPFPDISEGLEMLITDDRSDASENDLLPAVKRRRFNLAPSDQNIIKTQRVWVPLLLMTQVRITRLTQLQRPELYAVEEPCAELLVHIRAGGTSSRTCSSDADAIPTDYNFLILVGNLPFSSRWLASVVSLVQAVITGAGLMGGEPCGMREFVGEDGLDGNESSSTVAHDYVELTRGQTGPLVQTVQTTRIAHHPLASRALTAHQEPNCWERNASPLCAITAAPLLAHHPPPSPPSLSNDPLPEIQNGSVQEWSVYHMWWCIVNQASKNGEMGVSTMEPEPFSPLIRCAGIYLDRQRDMKAPVPSCDSLPNTLPEIVIFNEEDSSGSGALMETIEKPFELKGLKMDVPKEALVAISSLLQALHGEMRKTDSSVAFGGSVAYAPRTPRIRNTTLRENIRLGDKMTRKILRCHSCIFKVGAKFGDASSWRDNWDRREGDQLVWFEMAVVRHECPLPRKRTLARMLCC
ncbi:hypothetical protein FIBSPDRAFT_1053873 [Athelia psychrophila]|uniref:3'-5' exonuclease n=1 Tax=Athelia psychrophila TaxID=1759441 RepID=A0A167W9Y1_9AGAM|nr:hypothetical protein FIBSPDRAFT_1053873 [Fibularhizoctonia sp. CBS 109695]